MNKENPMTKAKLDYQRYPDPVAHRSGAKVGWNYYRDREDAEACAAAAKHNASIQESLGYDFGWCAPGSITLMTQGDHTGMWEVCLP
jgi:hypothetical protein